jgi:DNA-binding SARP family transcriptional activator
VRAYNRCKKRLRDGLGVAPSAKVTALFERISRPDGGESSR